MTLERFIHEDSRKAQWPEQALDAATKFGKVNVTITLRGGEFFTPKTGYMSEIGVNNQADANQKAFEEIFSIAGIAPIHAQNKASYLLGFVSTQLTYEELQSLYVQADKRILDVHLNTGGKVNMQTSMDLLNMPETWAAGYTAVGQNIIVVDTGIRKDHVFFSPVPPATKVTFEACFGTTGADPNTGLTYTTPCPNPTATCDSPLNTPGSGAQLSEPVCTQLGGVVCGHGTHVAGIAAANTGTTTTPIYKGVAPSANLISVRAVSVRQLQNAATYIFFENDVLDALNTVHANTVVGTLNPFTVNMSLNLGPSYSGSCDGHNPSFTSAIHNLASRGVPVVVATGNDSHRNFIRYPSCISQTIKVSGVENNLVGNAIYTQGNYGVPNNYIGGANGGGFFLAPSGGGATFVWSSVHTGVLALNGFQGTSQAAPHVAGIYAAIKAAMPGSTVAGATAWLNSTGSVQVNLDLGTPNGVQAFRRLQMPF
jgi:subtilisin family serine protease